MTHDAPLIIVLWIEVEELRSENVQMRHGDGGRLILIFTQMTYRKEQ
jgi:hypothetical protein